MIVLIVELLRGILPRAPPGVFVAWCVMLCVTVEYGNGDGSTGSPLLFSEAAPCVVWSRYVAPLLG